MNKDKILELLQQLKDELWYSQMSNQEYLETRKILDAIKGKVSK